MLADRDNLKIIPTYVTFFYVHAPSGCWGRSGVINEWREFLKNPDNDLMSG